MVSEYPRSHRGIELTAAEKRTQFEASMPPDAMHLSALGKPIRKIKTRADIENLPPVIITKEGVK